MKFNSTQTLSLALILLSACSSAPKTVEVQNEFTEAPSVTDILTERVVAQLPVVAEELGNKALSKVLGQAMSEALTPAAKQAVEATFSQAAKEVGVHYAKGEKLSDFQATQILKQVLANNTDLRNHYINSSDDALARVAKMQEKNLNIASNVKVNSVDNVAKAKSIYEALNGAPAARQLTGDFLTYAHYTGADLINSKSCITYKTKLDAVAQTNVVKFYNEQAAMAKRLAESNKGLSQSKLSQCALKQGTISAFSYFKNLNYTFEQTVQVIRTTEDQCFIPRVGTAAEAELLAKNYHSFAEVESLRSDRCN